MQAEVVAVVGSGGHREVRRWREAATVAGGVHGASGDFVISRGGGGI